eukprot:TRINITY_DN878_c2_g1_i2.p1 TRINITY_DN878_c2_g1~~TRINITY_DN878_c2_g1_i2.p1  ORF type:complete len:689 (+),score=146.64 TRINITY_DN878_c2_g1_i2:66-2069(+)
MVVTPKKAAQLKSCMSLLALFAVIIFAAMALAVLFVTESKVLDVQDDQDKLIDEINKTQLGASDLPPAANSNNNNNNHVVPRAQLDHNVVARDNGTYNFTGSGGGNGGSGGGGDLKGGKIGPVPVSLDTASATSPTTTISTITLNNDYYSVNSHQEDDLITSVFTNGYPCDLNPPISKLPAAGFWDKPLRNLGRLFARLQTDLAIDGGAIGIVYDQSVIYNSTWGVLTRNTTRQVTGDSLFRIGGITRLITSILAHKERDSGAIKMDNHIGSIVPGFGLKSQYKNQRYSIRSILADLSGMPLNTPPNCSLSGCNFTTAEMVKMINASTLQAVRPPYWIPSRSNLGYALVGRGLESVARNTYENLVQSNVLSPLNMFNTVWQTVKTSGQASNVATGYEADADIPDYDLEWARPWGGLYSNLRDLVKLLAALNLVEAKRDSSLNEVILPQSMRELMLPLFMNPDTKTGQASPFQVSYLFDKVVRTIDGGIKGYGSHLLVVPGLRIAVVAIGNKGETDMSQFTIPVARMLIPIVQNQLRLQQAGPTPPPNGTDQFTGPFEGLNTIGMAGTVVVGTNPAGALTISDPRLPEGLYYELAYQSELNTTTEQGQRFTVNIRAQANNADAQDSLTCINLFNLGANGDVVDFTQLDTATNKYRSLVLQGERYVPPV